MSAAASLKEIRLSQLRALTPRQITKIIEEIRASKTIPKLDYHFKQHGWEFNAGTPQEYLDSFREHLQRGDLRIFSFVRSERDAAPFWALVAPDTGAAVLYNERKARVWSFYRPGDADIRMPTVQALWLEAHHVGARWTFEEDWVWKA